MEITTFAEKWYSKTLPKLLGEEFNRFAARSSSLVEPIAKAEMKIDTKAQSAYTDGETIFLPGLYFIPEFYQKLGYENPFEKTALAITAINGSMIHEALHISLSKCNMIEMTENNERASELVKTDQAFGTILGLVEDLYIENFGRLSFKRISNFMIGKNDIIFSPSEFAKRFQEFEETPNKTNLLNVMFCRKNVHIDNDKRWSKFEQFVEAFNEAKSFTLENDDRVFLALKIYDMFESEETKEQYSMQEDESFNQNPSEGESETIESKELSEEIQAMISEILEQFVKEIEDTGKSFEKEVEKIHMSDLEIKESDLSDIPELRYKDILKDHKPGADQEVSKTFSKFAASFRYMYEEKHTLGRPNNRGTKIVKQRLPRILTDNKVLAYHDKKSVVRGKPKVIILLDASGSTGGRLWEEERKAATGAFLSLQKAGISVAMYAHTSECEEDDIGDHVPTVYGVAAYNMPLGNNQRIIVSSKINDRFSALRSIRLLENFDGFAIKYVSQCFPNTPGTNILLIFSDGEPAGGYRYCRPQSVEHTREVVKQSRNNRINVISVSLVESVKAANDKIYGKEHNVSAWSGMLEKSLQSVLTSLLIK